MNLQQQCLDRIENAYVVCEKHYGRKFNRPEITFSNRMTRVAGKAIYVRVDSNIMLGKEIRLSNKLLEINGRAFVEDTPGHEAAHLIAVELYGASAMGHGSCWREVMGIIGQTASEFHKHKMPKKRKFLYSCGKTLSIIRHNRLQRGGVEYYKWLDGSVAYASDFIQEL